MRSDTVRFHKSSRQGAALSGNLTELNSDTSPGLFEGSGGNKYIVGDDGEYKFAVILHHPTVPPFSWRPLSDKRLDRGIWRGPYRLRLTHAVPGTDSRKTGKAWSGDVADERSGIVAIGDGLAMLRCRRNKRAKIWMPLGSVSEMEFCDYSGWVFVAADNGELFFEKVAPGQRPAEMLEVLGDRPELTADFVCAPSNTRQR